MLAALIVIFVISAILRFPIALAVGIACMLAIWFFSDISLIVLVQRMVTGVDTVFTSADYCAVSDYLIFHP